VDRKKTLSVHSSEAVEMTTFARTRGAAFIAVASLVFSACMWAWVLSRPEGTFHDQGGLAITLIYFPATFCTWLVCAMLSAGLLFLGKSRPMGVGIMQIRRLRWLTLGLVALGLCLSAGTLILR